VLVLVLGLLGPVARQARHGTAHRARDAVAHARRVVVELPAGFLLLPGAVLLAAGLLEALLRRAWLAISSLSHGK
jgi:hypothetical protein